MAFAKVSIIIPVYNIEKYIARCLDSVVAQTYPHFEVLVVDDGSTDQSGAVIEQYLHEDERIQWIRKANGGQASARNLALQKASGDYILMVDGDDAILPNLLENCVSKLNQGADIVLFDYMTLSKKGQQQYISVGTSAISAGTAPWNKMYRTTLWQDTFFPEGCWYEDLGIVPYVLLKAKHICKIDKALYVYDQSRENSQTNTVNTTRYTDILRVLTHLKQLVETLPDTHTSFVQGMYLEQLGYVMALSKSQHISDKTERRAFLQMMQAELEKVCPQWFHMAHRPESIVMKNMRRMAIKAYFRGHFLLGDMLYVWPKKLKQIGAGS
ncbi:glycosyltransferase family 2 protein [Paenilisteria rocourtiae]|uniref:Glycosyl transferase family 2 n=1 Tax=Listeria rocourtiae TaxID=647910 RepID=A0A4V3DQ41_9LIST|nr:glycosyltransferase family A protein [Listeria rocourtiae]EUJ48383.1 glycosyl transferase family protein [Listeria rocourtiae FSL F6-920]MBC1605875.1 glycosyltransferase family 2 protein [Listeria rocourtiae]TDR54756.1 glycosyl transferase family 2 [Listeria rocourtiae]